MTPEIIRVDLDALAVRIEHEFTQIKTELHRIRTLLDRLDCPGPRPARPSEADAPTRRGGEPR